MEFCCGYMRFSSQLRTWTDNNFCKSQNWSAFALGNVSESQKHKQTETIQYQNDTRVFTPISLKRNEWIKNPTTKPIISLYFFFFSSVELIRQSKNDFVLAGRWFKTQFESFLYIPEYEIRTEFKLYYFFPYIYWLVTK